MFHYIYGASAACCTEWHANRLAWLQASAKISDLFSNLKWTKWQFSLIIRLTSDFRFVVVILLQESCILKRYLKGVVCNSNPIHFWSNSANISSRSTRCAFCVCAEKNLVFIHSPGSVNEKQTELLVPSRTTHACPQDNILDNSEFDRGIICVFCEYSTVHLSPVSDSFIIGVSKSINIHCIQQVTRRLNKSSLLQRYDLKRILLWFNCNEHIKRMLK